MCNGGVGECRQLLKIDAVHRPFYDQRCWLEENVCVEYMMSMSYPFTSNVHTLSVLRFRTSKWAGEEGIRTRVERKTRIWFLKSERWRYLLDNPGCEEFFEHNLNFACWKHGSLVRNEFQGTRTAIWMPVDWYWNIIGEKHQRSEINSFRNSRGTALENITSI